jgi:S-adenosylmethionine hydrolase
MTIVTLITDLGLRDWYAGALKGALLKRASDLHLVDISHAVEPFDIVQGALLARNTWPEFPEGSIHLIAVNCVYEEQPQFVAARHAGHFFIAPDNGVLSLLLGEIPLSDLRRLPAPAEDQAHFAIKTVFPPAVAHLADGRAFDQLGTAAEAALLRRIGLRPVINNAQIRGTVIHVDHFENVVLNIDRELFDHVSKNRPFSLYFKRNDPITALSANYGDVPVGEPLCLFNSAGLLEIAVNFGKAATLFGLKKEDVIELIFET